MSEYELDDVSTGERDEFVSDGIDTELELIKERFKEIEEDANKLHTANSERAQTSKIIALCKWFTLSELIIYVGRR